MASLTSVRTSVVSGGALCVVGCAVLAVLLPTLNSCDARRGPASRPAAGTAPSAVDTG